MYKNVHAVVIPFSKTTKPVEESLLKQALLFFSARDYGIGAKVGMPLGFFLKCSYWRME